ncbi:MAG: ribonuclease HI family protein [Caldilineaceae bacterium]|nr:ribonuclease HI family protein [Caldilineaceae bacterium]
MWNFHKVRLARVWVFCDGGLSVADYGDAPRPAPALEFSPGCGALVRNDDGAILDWAWRTLPQVTSVEAEYAGLLLGVELARRQATNEVIFVMDSAVVVGQMTGRFAVNSPRLRRWYRQACEATQRLPKVGFRHVPRAWNPLADALARQAGLPWAALRAQLEKE